MHINGYECLKVVIVECYVVKGNGDGDGILCCLAQMDELCG
jgi:hypothetical protein